MVTAEDHPPPLGTYSRAVITCQPCDAAGSAELRENNLNLPAAGRHEAACPA